MEASIKTVTGRVAPFKAQHTAKHREVAQIADERRRLCEAEGAKAEIDQSSKVLSESFSKDLQTVVEALATFQEKIGAQRCNP